MSDFTSIAAVTTTLRNLLEDSLAGITVDDLQTPADYVNNQAAINICLYRVERHPFSANLDWQPRPQGDLRAPPLGLTLHYLFTPYGPNQVEMQRTLGELMRALHDRAVLQRGDPLLADALADTTEELRIVPHGLPFSELLDLWRGFGESAFRLSATYEVSAILIDSANTRSVQRVQERLIELAPLR